MTEDALPRSPAAPLDADAAGVTTHTDAADVTTHTPAASVDTGTTTAGLDADTPVTGADTATPDDGTDDTEQADSGRRRRGRPKGATSSARTTRVVELCLTVSEGADGEWQAELKQGATWVSRGLPVAAASVLRAAQELHPELAEPIEAAIGAAREARAARVAALEAELEQARKALAELDA